MRMAIRIWGGRGFRGAAGTRGFFSRRRVGFLISLGVVAAGLTSPDLVNAQYTHRLTRIVYDFDANGVPDADKNLTYNGAGEVTASDYTYFGDATPDLFNTEDDATVQEDSTIGYDGSGRVDDIDTNRGAQGSFSVDALFSGSEWNRIDLVQFDGGGSPVLDVFFDFQYTGGDLVTVENRHNANNALISTLAITYGSNGLPDQVDSISAPPANFTVFNALTWNAKGDIETITTTTTGGVGSGTATYTYLPGDTGQLDTEVFTQTGAVGVLYSEAPGNDYRKSHFYDANNLRIREEWDIGDDASVEAILTFEWTAGTCNPAFEYAPNGPPNFSTMPQDLAMVPAPYVPGTGAFYSGNCGPFPVPEPSSASLLAAGVFGLAGLVRRKTGGIG